MTYLEALERVAETARAISSPYGCIRHRSVWPSEPGQCITCDRLREMDEALEALSRLRPPR